MKLNEKLILRKIGNRYMIANTCSGTWDMACVYTLNETAAFLWQRIGKEEFSPQLLAEWLHEEYEVGMDKALEDVNHLLADWIKEGLVVVS